MSDIFREVRERLDMDTVARHYGFHPNRASFIRCPFHAGDRTASLKLYPGQRGWHCFGCQVGGSVVDFMARLFALTPLDAVRRLNEDFSLGLPINRPATAAECQEVQHRREVSATYRDFEGWKDSLSKLLSACFRTAHTALLSLEGPDDIDRLTPAQVLAIQWQPAMECWSDSLAGSIEEQMAVFRDRREVERLCGQILRTMPMKSGAA